ncbi:MAG: TonB-dependent receptor [Acidobacteria bacterium]|nr:TonB-dependent receptor [Acidobacteriota bacterium]
MLDPSDAVVPGASVTVVNQDSGFRRVTDTGLDGGYVVGALEGGLYKITVRKDGFVGMMRFDVRVPERQPARADFKLTVGAVEETITVEGTEPLVTTDDASIGVRVFHDEIRNLPLNGRGVLGLVELSPGTNVTPATRGESGQFTANGQRPNANYFTVDGASANTGVAAGGLPAQATGGVLPAMTAFGSLDSLLPVEAVDEFRVQTANTPGDLGRLPGANVSLTSRSGSNQFHGSVVYRVRHELLAANDWFANYSGEGRGPLRLNDVAPSFGGPLRRNRTFFFLSFEHMDLRGPYVTRQPVPSAATRAAAPDWVRPALDLYPLPNGADVGNGLGLWYGRNIRPSHLTSGLARLDEAITPRVTLFARYNDSPSSNEFGATEVNRLDLRFRSLTLGLNYRPGARFTFDLRANESQSEAESTWSVAGSNVSSGCDLAPLTAYLFPAANACNSLVRFSVGGVGQVVLGSEGRRRQRQFQLLGSAGLNVSGHSLRVGADYRRILPIRRDASGMLSSIADDITSLTDKRNLWLGSAAALSTSAEVSELSLWVQDAWRISSRLTVTPGLRWEFNPSPVPGGTAWFLNPAQNLFEEQHRALWPVSYMNFAPRLSAVWRLDRDGRTVLRAGAGLFYDSSLSIATDLINGGPLSITQLLSGKAGLFSSILSYGYDPALRLPRISEWNLTLDRALSRNDALSIGYAGSKGRRLIRRELGGAGNTPTALFALTTNHGESDYEGLQVQYRRRVAQGLQALASYAWSHSLDNDSSDAFLMWAGADSPHRDYGSSDFDLRQSLSVAMTWDAPRRLGGWSIDGLLRARTGFPITVLVNEQYQGIALANAFRPYQLLDQSLWIDDPNLPGGRGINAAAFMVPAAGTQGSLGRNSITGFGMGQVDLAVRRDWRWWEHRTIEARLEAFNLLNTAAFADPVRYLSSPVFGQSTSMLNVMLGTGSPGSGLAPILQTGGARSFQATVRLRF